MEESTLKIDADVRTQAIEIMNEYSGETLAKKTVFS